MIRITIRFLFVVAPFIIVLLSSAKANATFINFNAVASCDDESDAGVVYYDQGQFAAALQAFQEAVICYQKTQDREGEGVALNGIAATLSEQGRFAEALQYYNLALEIRRSFHDLVGEGITLNGIGAVHARLGDYEQALNALQRASDIAQALNAKDDEGVALSNIGWILTEKGDYDEALAVYNQALSLRRQASDRLGEGVTLNNMAAVYLLQGSYAPALDAFLLASAIAHNEKNVGNEAVALNGAASVYFSQGRYQNALDRYEQILSLPEISPYFLARILNNLAVTYKRLGRSTDAIMAYDQAQAIQQAINDPLGKARTLNNLAELLLELGDVDEAHNLLRQALAIQRKIGARNSEGVSLNNIGGVYEAQAQYAAALGVYRQALTIFEETDNRLDEAYTRSNIALMLHQLGQQDDALVAYEAGLAVLESIRTTAGSESGRASFISQFSSSYNRVIAWSIEQNRFDLAYLMSERGRARALLDSLATGRVELSDNAAAKLIAQENTIYIARQSAQDALQRAQALSSPDPQLVADLTQQLVDINTSYTTVLAAIQSRQDQLADLTPGHNNNVLSLSDVQKQLDDQTTLISYWMLENKTVAFLITADNLTLVQLSEATAENIVMALTGLYQWNNTENPHPRPLRNLHAWLVDPLVEHLDTPHVAIIPHQLLHYIPFTALTDGETYFGEQYTLSVLPSASVLPFLAQNAQYARADSDHQALVFGNPQTALPALPAAAAEAQAVADLLQTSVYLDAQASELSLRATLTATRILHLAAHGEYNLANPLYSTLHLAATENDDGRLETHEIFGLSLQGNDLVVLSACQTNLNELTETSAVAVSRGDEIVGLTRAFFFAGAPTVISSLWSVDDGATETLMVSFYQHWLQDGLSKAEALQAAQAEVRANPRWASPFYWAGFVLNGDPGQRNHASSVK